MPSDHGETAFRLLLRPELEELLELHINVKDVLRAIVEAGLIKTETLDEIRKCSTNRLQLQLLLQEIQKNSGPGTVERFLSCLRNAQYDHSATIIHQYLIKLYSAYNDSAREIQIKSGLVPTQPEFHVVRKKLFYEIKDKIIEASMAAVKRQGTHWILVHGMPGNGKSYLAAAALRSPEIWKICFGDGIYWLDIGKPGAEKLLIKLGVLCQMVDSKPSSAFDSSLNSQSSDVETVLQRLASAFATHHPNSAIVLDDVWDESVIKAFEKVACRCIVVTSRRRDIVKSIKAGVTYIDINSGFTESESQEYLAQILKKSVEDLPKEAVLIHNEISGSPMVMALIGGMLRDHHDFPERWKHYLAKLTDMPQKVMSMHSNTPYEHHSIDEAIALSVESLKEDLREKFFDLAVFDDDVPIPQKVFTTLWSTQTEDDAADELAHFVNSSLCTRDYCAQRQCILYRFHDLILLYARNHIPVKNQSTISTEELQVARTKALQDKHRKLFMKYHSVCNGKFEKLPNDFYIHNFIGYHMSLGKMMADIKQLYDNKAFMEQRLEFAGAEVVLVDLLLLKKQHPSFSDQLQRLEIELRNKYPVTLNSPDVRSNRRSLLFEEHLTSRRASSASLADLDLTRLKSPENGQKDQENIRDRASSSDSAVKTLKTVHSEPVVGTITSWNSPSHQGNKENSAEILPKINVRKNLYSNQFDEEND